MLGRPRDQPLTQLLRHPGTPILSRPTGPPRHDRERPSADRAEPADYSCMRTTQRRQRNLRNLRPTPHTNAVATGSLRGPSPTMPGRRRDQPLTRLLRHPGTRILSRPPGPPSHDREQPSAEPADYSCMRTMQRRWQVPQNLRNLRPTPPHAAASTPHRRSNHPRPHRRVGSMRGTVGGEDDRHRPTLPSAAEPAERQGDHPEPGDASHRCTHPEGRVPRPVDRAGGMRRPEESVE
jgi:hypothetical protein